MAGLINPESVKEPLPSLPLYLAGGLVVLCGIFAANAAITQPDYVWMTRTLVLSGLGLLLSYGARRFRVPSGVLDGLVVGLLALLLLALATQALPVEALLPLGADKGEQHLLAELVWGACAWTFLLRTDVRVLEVTIPVMAALGLAAEVDLNNPVLVCFGVFIVTVIFLLIHQNYLQNQVRAASPSPAPVEEPRRLLLAQFVQTGLCGLCVLLAGLVVIKPAQAVFSRLSLAQAIRQLAAGKATPVAPASTLRFSDEDSLALGTGEGWTASTEVVMQVRSSDRQPHYWRGRTYDRYTGSRWESTLEGAATLLPPGQLSAGGREVIFPVPAALTPGDAPAFPVGTPQIQAFFRVQGETDQFYGASRPQQIILRNTGGRDGHTPRAGADGRLDMDDNRTIRGYGIVSALAPDLAEPGVEARLRRAGTAYPEEVRRLYLPVEENDLTQSSDVDFYKQAVAEATQSLPPARQTPLDRALALRQWVSQRCVYSLAVKPIPDGEDHVRAFLGDTRQGYCDMFASSLAILCRTAGIPARLVTGFAPGEAAGDIFNLRGEDKHAWTEVYFPGDGWVALDATEGSASDGSVPGAASSRTASLWEWLSRLRLGLGAGWELVYPLLLVMLALVGYVLKTEVFDRWRAKRAAPASAPAPQAAPRTALGRRYLRMSRALARMGLPRRPSETPGEYAARVQPRLRQIEAETGVPLPADLVPSLTAAFTQAAYGDPAARPSASTWEMALHSLESGSWRVWGKTLGQRKKSWNLITPN